MDNNIKTPRLFPFRGRNFLNGLQSRYIGDDVWSILEEELRSSSRNNSLEDSFSIRRRNRYHFFQWGDALGEGKLHQRIKSLFVFKCLQLNDIKPLQIVTQAIVTSKTFFLPHDPLILSHCHLPVRSRSSSPHTWVLFRQYLCGL
ncbi:hypothetical protein TNCV_2822541 [Trichonephila clavipes]|nr:hypothetical protein TNCV_2822541 [Trichonephila clavipes]